MHCGRQKQIYKFNLYLYVNCYLSVYYLASERPLQATTSAPKFVDKTSEYENIYGEKAEKILSLEASMQLTFDKFCDESKPKYWPNIPLKF